MNCIALIIKEARKFKMQGGYSKYDLCMNITEIQVSLQPTQLSLEATIPWCSHLKFRM